MENNQSGQPGYNRQQNINYQQGYNQQGYNQQGYNQQGYNQQGYNQQGYNRQNYYQQQGYGSQNFNRPPYAERPTPCRPYVESNVNNPFNCGPEGKSRGIYAILAMFLGSIGMHYFYINKAGAGIITIILTIVTCGMWAILPLIQGVLALWTLTNEDFDARFVATTNFFPFF